ncbi:helix-turn-helix domain-containing protein [Agrobacterium sp. NPDC090273]|uniref:helix-turn-helix domain-containing protein n=1 Tax=Agrobacterium sp. NPDC090273 TaxID=3363919 RepID=UPI00383AC0E1
MSQSNLELAKPVDSEAISPRALGYVTENARAEVFDLVVRNCIESGISNALLAKRMGKDPAQISRLLGAPGNWTIDTIAKLLFAIDGRFLNVDSYWPEDEARANMRHATCFVEKAKLNVVIVRYNAPRRPVSKRCLSWTN